MVKQARIPDYFIFIRTQGTYSNCPTFTTFFFSFLLRHSYLTLHICFNHAVISICVIMLILISWIQFWSQFAKFVLCIGADVSLLWSNTNDKKKIYSIKGERQENGETHFIQKLCRSLSYTLYLNKRAAIYF